MSKEKLLINNKKAYYDYNVIDTIECGLVLTGQEVKSIKDGGASIVGGRIYGKNNELYVFGLHIAPYSSYTSDYAHNPDREKKLLAKKKEIRKILDWEQEKGHAIIPLRVRLKENNRLKIDVGLCIGKKKYDKRESEKKKEITREIQKSFKNNQKY